MDYYEVLQVEKSATGEEIKRAYQNLAKTHHPDKSRDQNSKKFLEIDKAYQILKDPAQRRAYDSEQFLMHNVQCIIHDTVTKKDFSYDEVEKIFYYTCKCGSFYTLENIDTAADDLILSCDECSLNIMLRAN